MALVGPNGAGKTTLLRTVAGAHRPTRGHIRLGADVLFDSSSGVDLPVQQRRVGYMPQGYGLLPHLSVIDNVGFGWLATRPRASEAERRRAASATLTRLGCAELASRSPSELSGGESQRVALARALMIEPRILLLDEPLAALDVPARRRLRTFLSDYLEARAEPALIVTHDVRDVRALGADVVVIEAGRVIQRGTVEDVTAAPATEFVAEFFGG